jgi:hypothetical protein
MRATTLTNMRSTPLAFGVAAAALLIAGPRAAFGAQYVDTRGEEGRAAFHDENPDCKRPLLPRFLDRSGEKVYPDEVEKWAFRKMPGLLRGSDGWYTQTETYTNEYTNIPFQEARNTSFCPSQ